MGVGSGPVCLDGVILLISVRTRFAASCEANGTTPLLYRLSIGAHVYRAFDKAPFPFIRSFHDITAVLGDS
ncbi:hypothetical protein EDD15DRAFT_2279999 [Pisolithus albus]|nr:hypothetical protein EDD15DRAFT_2279999 [Pisolithus albus]